MAKKKVVDMFNYILVKQLKRQNQLVEGQKRALRDWRKIRLSQPKASSNPDAVFLMKQITGYGLAPTGAAGKKMLKDLKKFRKRGAQAVRSSEKRTYGKVKVGQGKSAPNLLRALKHNIEGRAHSLKQWKDTGAKKDFIAEMEAKQKMYKEAKSGLQNRMINARGKGIRFIRRKDGQIVPIRPKRK